MHRNPAHRSSVRGGVLLATLPVVVVLASLGAALLSITLAHSNEQNQALRERRASLLADSEAVRAIAAIELARDAGQDPPATIGTEAAPVQLRQGWAWTTIDEVDTGLFAIRSVARVGRSSRAVEAVVELPVAPLYDYAIFAGNSSGDPDYALRLSGTGGDADSIRGSIYSGGDLLLDGDSYVTGDVHAKGAVSGGAGTDGLSQPIPDIAGMDYATNHDYDVAALFATAYQDTDENGGRGWQLADTNPAHIFRRNPSDRKFQWDATAKDDYYLEDPHEPIGVDRGQDGSDPNMVTFSGNTGTDKVFYIDGNLWVDNRPTFSFQFRNEDGSPVRVTFVVRGNIVFGDNLFYDNPDTDAVAFIAIEDPAVADSGNIMFGDERGGTLEYMAAFMYAENDFYDHHLDASGSKSVTIHGNMTAGNKVAIERDYVRDDGTVAHSQLTIDFDDRISTGTVGLAGLPSSEPETTSLTTRMWRRVGTAR